MNSFPSLKNKQKLWYATSMTGIHPCILALLKRCVSLWH